MLDIEELAKLITMPCPFCGSHILILDKYYPYDGYQNESENFRIRCVCGVIMEKGDASNLVQCWNRRTKL